jgi:hypothetical protein
MNDGKPYGYHGAGESADADSMDRPEILIQDEIARGRNAFAQHVAQGSKEALTGWLIIVECLYHIREYRDPDTGKPLSADQYLQAAKQIGIRNRSDAMELPRLYPYIDRIWAKCDHDEAAANARGVGYEYPGWRKAFAPFKPAKPKPEKAPAAPPVATPDIATKALADLDAVRSELKAERDRAFELEGKAKQAEESGAKRDALVASFGTLYDRIIRKDHKTEEEALFCELIQAQMDIPAPSEDPEAPPEPQNDVGADESMEVSEAPPDASQTDLNSDPPGTPDGAPKAPETDLADPPIADVSTKPARAKKAGRKARKAATVATVADPERRPEADQMARAPVPPLFENFGGSWESVDKEPDETEAEYEARLRVGWASGAYKTQEAVEAAMAAPLPVPEAV